MTDLTLAAIGCSGPVAEIFLRGFLDRGVAVRVLARDPDAVRARHPDVEVIRGSIMESADVAGAVEEHARGLWP